MKVGDKVWLFSENWREYKDGLSGPIYEKHFRQFTIDGETSRSWLVGREKFPKHNNPINIYTDEYKSDAIWKEENQRKIIDKVRCCSIQKLKQINEILAT